MEPVSHSSSGRHADSGKSDSDPEPDPTKQFDPWQEEVENLRPVHKNHDAIIADLAERGVTSEQWGQLREQFERLGETPQGIWLQWVSKIAPDLETGEIGPDTSPWTWVKYPVSANPSKLKFVEIAKDAAELLTGNANEDAWLDLLRETNRHGFSGSTFSEDLHAVNYSRGWFHLKGSREHYVSGVLHNVFTYSARLALKIEKDLARHERKRRAQGSPSPEVCAIQQVQHSTPGVGVPGTAAPAETGDTAAQPLQASDEIANCHVKLLPDSNPARDAAEAVTPGVGAPIGTSAEERAIRRKSFVTPLLEQRRLTVYAWEKTAKVGHKTGQKYLNGKTKALNNDTRKRLSSALGVDPKDLPE